MQHDVEIIIREPSLSQCPDISPTICPVKIIIFPGILALSRIMRWRGRIKGKKRRKGIPGTETSSFRRAFRSAWKTSEPSKKGIAGIRANERKGADGTHLFYVPRPSERFNAFSKQTSSLLKRLCYLFKHTIRRFARGTFL